MFDSITSIHSDHSSSSSPTLEGSSIEFDKFPDKLSDRSAIPSKSDKFWFEDGTVVIRVENTLYKLYKGIFTRQSEFFRSAITAVLTSLPSAMKKKGKAGMVTYGEPQLIGTGSCSNPLFLLVKREDFELLLSYIFPKDYSTQNDFTVSEWASIAAISRTLEMTSIQAAAIARILEDADPFDLIDVGNDYELIECCSEGFRQLCVREGSLSLKEGQRLGLQYVIAIAHGRDLLSKDSKWFEIEKAVLVEAGITTWELQQWRIVHRYCY